ncbi:MAG: hypothetical protein IPK08_15845 [Bacteroidetes bacterium]|nr:hypothetical protein [Bacteroidota bacterium]
MYQHLMNYWSDVMQDDCYLIAIDGWKAEPYRIVIDNKQGKKVDKGWTCDLNPPELIIGRYFHAEKVALEELESSKESYASENLSNWKEEHSGEEGFLLISRKK